MPYSKLERSTKKRLALGLDLGHFKNMNLHFPLRFRHYIVKNDVEHFNIAHYLFLTESHPNFPNRLKVLMEVLEVGGGGGGKEGEAASRRILRERFILSLSVAAISPSGLFFATTTTDPGGWCGTNFRHCGTNSTEICSLSGLRHTLRLRQKICLDYQLAIFQKYGILLGISA